MDLGLLGGIGEGIKSGVESYRDTNYKNEEIALKKRLARAQEIEAAAKWADITGESLPETFPSDIQHAKNPYTGDTTIGYSKAGQNPFIGYSPAGPQLPSQQAQGSGLVAQQAGPQQLPSTAKTQPGMISAGAQPSNAQYPPSSNYPGWSQFVTEPTNTPYVAKRVREGSHQAAQMSASTIKEGIRVLYDPKTNGFVYTSVPISKEHELDISSKQNQVKNSGLEPEYKTQQEYSAEKVVGDVKETAFNYQKMVEAAKNPSPIADKGLVYNYIRLENPGAIAREGSLEDLRNVPGLGNQYRNLIENALNGTLSDQTRNDLLRTGASVYNAARAQHKDVINKYSQIAKERGANATFLKHPELDRLDKVGASELARIGPYVKATERPGLVGGAARMAQGFLGVSQDKPAMADSSGPNGPSVKQNGITYTWNPQSKRYE